MTSTVYIWNIATFYACFMDFFQIVVYYKPHTLFIGYVNAFLLNVTFNGSCLSVSFDWGLYVAIGTETLVCTPNHNITIY